MHCEDKTVALGGTGIVHEILTKIRLLEKTRAKGILGVRGLHVLLVFSFSHSGELLSIVHETNVGGSSIFRFVWVNILKYPSIPTSPDTRIVHENRYTIVETCDTCETVTFNTCQIPLRSMYRIRTTQVIRGGR
jgi:hypothetical protein